MSLSQEECKYQTDACSMMQRMRDVREAQYKEFNNLRYSDLYNLNREADLWYSDMNVLVNQQNSGDSITSEYQMTTGATRTKDKAIVSHLLAFNFEADITAYDKENELVNELGENTEDLVNRSAEVEDWDDKRRDIYSEFVTQGNVFVREVCMKYAKKQHDNGRWVVGDKISSFVPDKNSITKYEKRCERQFIPGKNVYLSNIRERNIQKQDVVFVWEEMSFAKAKKIFGKWDRWEFVEATKNKTLFDDFSMIIQEDQRYVNGIWWSENYWNVRKPEDEMGIVHIYNHAECTYQIFLNGIMMLPVGYSMYEVSPSGNIPIAKGDAEIITGFAYSKGVPVNTIVDTKMFDQVYNAVTQKMMQSANPTMGNMTGRVLPKWLVHSGRLISGLRAGQLEPILPVESRTITNSDSAFIDIVKGIINDKSVDDAFSGEAVGVKTATEMLERKKNTIMKLFGLVEGMIELEEQLVKLRIASIYSNWVVPEEVPVIEKLESTKEGVEKNLIETKKIYRKEFVATKFNESGKRGFRSIRFKGKDTQVPNMYDMMKEEDKLSKDVGKPVRITYIDVEQISKLMDWSWNIDVRAKKETDSQLEMMTYLDNKTRISNLFWPQILNKEYTLGKVSRFDWEDAQKAYNLEPAAWVPEIPGAPAPAVPNPSASLGQVGKAMWAMV